MKFNAVTAAPSGTSRNQEQIKDLLFAAVRLYVEDNPAARQELLETLMVREELAS